MAATKKPTSKSLVVQNINITPVNRRAQDIKSWRDALQSAEGLVPRRNLLYDLYFEILLDAHLSSVIDKRKIAVTNSEWVFSRNGDVDDQVTDIIRQPWFGSFLEDILDTRFWGYSVFEFDFSGDIPGYYMIPRKHIDAKNGFIWKNQWDMSGGIDFRQPPYSNFVMEVGKNDDLGLLLKAAQYVIYKRGNFGDWAQFAEVFGMPFRKATYDGYDDNVRLMLEKAMKEAGSASYVVIPKEGNIEFVANTSNGNGDLYDKLRNACNAEISILFLGQTLTTEQGTRGARSLGEVHLEVEDAIHYNDILFCKYVLNYTFRRLLEKHGYNLAGGEFTKLESDSIPLEKRVLIDTQLAGIIPIDDDYFYKKYGIPKPAAYNQIKKQRELEKKAAQQQAVNAEIEKNKENKLSFLERLESFFSGAPR